MSVNIWLIIGVACLLLEVMAIPGIGFLFAGLGALLLGGLLTFGFITASELTDQLVYFLFFTAVWWGILWQPLKRATKRTKGAPYENLADATGEVDDTRDLTPGKVGHIKWSGTRMRARIRPDSPTERIKNGETVWVHDQKDGILLVDITKKN